MEVIHLLEGQDGVWEIRMEMSVQILLAMLLVQITFTRM